LTPFTPASPPDVRYRLEGQSHPPNFFDGFSTPAGLILIMVGGYFLMTDFDQVRRVV
jgi:hypothetical protein